MTTSKIILTVVVIAVIGLLAGLGVRSMFKGSNSSTDTEQTSSHNGDFDAPSDGNGFAWGITVLTFPFPTYEEAFTGVQMAEVKKLGVNYVRVDYLPSNPEAAEKAVDEARKNGLKVVLIIPFGPKDIFTDKDLKKNTTNYVSDVVKRFKGKVAIYQLGGEVASVALANNASLHGIDVKDYPTGHLNAVTEWVKTANETVKKTDKTVKTLVNDQWVHTGFFDNYFAKGGDFDILGWNWFSDMGTNMESVVIDAKKNQKYELLAKLQGYDKPIWLTEVNRRLGSQGKNEKAQADFITQMAHYATSKDSIDGFFVYNLLEDQAAPVQERGYSIITATDNGTGKNQKITGRKPAFDAYQKIIQQNR